MNATWRFNRRGISITELMVAVMVLSVAVAGSFGAFKYIVRALHTSRTNSLAANLAQEKIEILKNLTYYGLQVTTDSAIIPGLSPSLYDTGNYGPQDISISGTIYTRYTYVALAQISGDIITEAAYNYPDTGLKQLTVTVVWKEGNVTKSYALSNLLQNSRVNTLSSSISGTVTKAAGGGVLAGAQVQIQGYPDWSTISAADGTYSIAVTSGYYTVRASSAEYFDAISAQQYAPPNSAATGVGLAMTAIGTGTIAGYVWLSPNLVISQVIVSTAQVGGTYSYSQLIELYNPTTAQINIANCTPGPTCLDAAPSVNLNMHPHNNGGVSDCTNIPLIYRSTYVASNHYYLIANQVNTVISNVKYTADAYYQTPLTACSDADSANNRILNVNKGGAVWISNSAGTIDAVGWTGPSGGPPAGEYEGTYINLATNGMQENTQLVRISSPTSTGAVGGDLETYGRAYDSGSNAADFWYNFGGQVGSDMATSVHPPYVSTAAVKLPIAGVPAAGAYVSASDTYSGSTRTYTSYITSGSLSLPYAQFRLIGVSTTPAQSACAGNCWTVEITSNAYYAQISTVAVTQNLTTWIPSTNTVFGSTGSVPSAMLATTTLNGFIEGNVSNINNGNLSGIQVLINGITKTTGANGDYFISTSSGPATIVANANYANSSYAQGVAAPTVVSGQISTEDFVLSQAGAIRGYAKTGTTPLPNILFSVTYGGNQVGSASTDNTGFFTVRNLSTGTYIVTPILDVGVASNPVWISTTVNAGSTQTVSTFTITNAFGAITGNVTYNGALVTSGALIMASTGTLTSPPASICGSSATSTTPIYAISSIADGTYSLPVRASSGYTLIVSMPIVSNSGAVTIISRSYPSITVSASQATPQNLVLPP